jgi:GxxExxY protein
MLPTKSYLKDLIYQVNGAAIEVHRSLGPGLLESVYHKCMKEEFQQRKIPYKCELPVPIIYKRIELISDLRCDFLVNEILVVELKAVETVHPVFEAQLLSYANQG